MTLAAPLLLAALGLLVPVIAAFLVRRRRDVVRVPSTLLFRLTAASTSQSRRMRSLKRIASLLACLLAVTALVFAAARPTAASRGETVAFVVDVSASMRAGPHGRPVDKAQPLDEARRFIQKVLAASGPEDRYAIIAAGAVPVRLAGLAPAGPRIEEALDALREDRAGADLGAAIELAAALIEAQPGARIVLLSDGGESLGDPAADLRDVPLTARTFPPALRDNLGVVVFATRPPADAAGDSERDALVGVATSSERPRTARVIVTAEGQEIARRRVEVPASGEAEVRVRVRAAAIRLLARVEPDDGIGDALASDDEATITAAVQIPPRVLLIDAGPAEDEASESAAFFAEKALIAAGAKEIVHVTPNLDPAEVKPGDVIVALGVGPSRRIDAPTLYLGTRKGALPFQGFHEIGAAEAKLRSVEGRDAILRGVVLDGLTVEHATAVDVPPAARALVELDGGTVVLAGGAGQRAWVYLGIDPVRSDLVLRVAFPVLVANALHAALGASNVAVADTVARDEIAMRAAPIVKEAPAEEPLSSFRLPANPAVLLAAFALALLALEAWTFRKGWAE
jgi:hypothetical protein